MWKRFSFSKKLMMIMGLFGTVVIAGGGISGYILFKITITGDIHKNLEYITNSTYNLVDTAVEVAIRSHLKTIAEDDKAVLTYYHGLVEQGKMSEQEAKDLVKQIILKKTIGKTGYVYCIDTTGTVRIHPKDALVNVNLSKYGFVQEQCQKKEGYLEYLWKNPDDPQERAKALYMTYFAPWDYIVSASSYKSEFNTLVTTKDFRDKVLGITIGKTGYLYIMDSKGELIIHPKLEGQNIYNSQDSSGKYFIREMCSKKNGQIIYPWKNPGEKLAREKIVHYRYLEEMDWIIASGVYLDELYAPLDLLLLSVIGGALLMLFCAGLLAIVLGRSLSKPIHNLAHYAELIGRGQLDVTIPITSRDEIGDLSNTFNMMAANLNRFIGQVQHSGIQVTSSSTELAATAKEQEAIMINQMNSMDTMVEKIKNMSEVSAQLMQTMQHLAAIAEETADSVSDGQTDLSRMGDAMQLMEKASKAISSRLETINEKTENITTVVTTITKVAEQTNLLSLNAAIEAEKAGDYGRGFTVVAREIRRLADQTAVATLDIERMVQAMQSAVASGVMEMDKFIAEVRHSADDVSKISNQLRRTIEHVQTLTPNIERVNTAMGEQSESTQQINIAIMELQQEMQETKASLHENYSAISQLNDAARTLQDEVSQFVVSESEKES